MIDITMQNIKNVYSVQFFEVFREEALTAAPARSLNRDIV